MIETPEGLVKPEVQLTGNDGNAFAIISEVSRGLKDEGNSQEIINTFIEEASSGDYDHLLQTAMAYAEVK